METSPAPKLNIKAAVEELNPEIAKVEDEDEILARLSTYSEWGVFREKVQKRIDFLREGTSVEMIDSIEAYGFKCLAKELMLEELQNLINSVELTAKFIKERNETGKGKN